jgi:hypothetical protein
MGNWRCSVRKSLSLPFSISEAGTRTGVAYHLLRLQPNAAFIGEPVYDAMLQEPWNVARYIFEAEGNLYLDVSLGRVLMAVLMDPTKSCINTMASWSHAWL